MAWTRQLASGLWASTVYTPNGRITETDPLRSVIETWAADLEAEVRQGTFLDPRLSRKTVGECWEKFEPSRRVEKASRRRDLSTWKCHVAPRWGNVAVGRIVKPDVSAWVNAMEKAGTGGWTIIASLNVLKCALELAVDAGWIRSNPARRVKAPVPPQHVDRVVEPDEEERLLGRLDELFPGRRDARLFVETLFRTGARWEEAAAVRRESVDLKRGVIRYGPVMERDGTIREYPKGARDIEHAGFRGVPIDDEHAARLRPVVMATASGGLVFTAPMGGSLLYPTWLRRVWNAALRVPTGKGEWRPLLALPLPTPHDARHTFGTRMADAGLEQHDRMALMGHGDERSARRYVHSDEEKRFNRLRDAMKKASGS
jgi:integrase